MRTTLTIDDDLMKALKDAAHRAGIPLKQLVNRALRRGLDSLEGSAAGQPYHCPTFAMGEPVAGWNLDKALALADELENEEIARKLELRK
jgi:hypothetical protein